VKADVRLLHKGNINRRDTCFVYRHSWPPKYGTSVALRFLALADFVCLTCFSRQLAYANMASVEAVHLGLSLASQLCVCSIFPLLASALVILSSLQFHWTSGNGGQTSLMNNTD